MQVRPYPFDLLRAALVLSGSLSFIAGTLLLVQRSSANLLVISTLALASVFIIIVLLLAD
jgi:preprotein translocase subunit SecG